MSADAKVQTYEALKLGYLPIQSLTIRHTIPPTIRSGQSLTLELRKGERIVTLTFIGLKDLRLADLGPGSSCLLRIHRWHRISGKGFAIVCPTKSKTLRWLSTVPILRFRPRADE